jgi:alkylresorcinol/alkylpyrone synthase
MSLPRIVALATALPRHRHRQSDLARAAEPVFGGDPRLRSLLPIFASCGVETRHLVHPLGDYLVARSFGARNDDFVAAATALGETALGGALAAAGLAPADLDHLIFATTTGLATPSIDALLLNRMGLRPDLERTPLFGIGCAAGAVGLSRAGDLSRARDGALVALLSVELCSLTFQLDDLSPQNIVGSALFGDGAAAALVSSAPGPGGPRIAGHKSHTFPGSLEVMGWRFGERGLELVLSKELPRLVEQEVEPLVTSFLASHGIKIGDLAHFVVHPGGPRVIDALERALALVPGQLDPTRRFLRDHGNLSSASVLFILAELIASKRAAAGDRGLLLAFGPGFSAEMLLLEW